jgi:hypothetical protein
MKTYSFSSISFVHCLREANQVAHHSFLSSLKKLLDVMYSPEFIMPFVIKYNKKSNSFFVD